MMHHDQRFAGGCWLLMVFGDGLVMIADDRSDLWLVPVRNPQLQLQQSSSKATRSPPPLVVKEQELVLFLHELLSLTSIGWCWHVI
jgi:hypothetical protein